MSDVRILDMSKIHDSDAVAVASWLRALALTVEQGAVISFEVAWAGGGKAGPE